jgi:hypothetical protein
LKKLINSSFFFQIVKALSSTIVFGLTISNFLLTGLIIYFLFGVLPHVDVSMTPISEINSFRFSLQTLTFLMIAPTFFYFLMTNSTIKYLYVSVPLAFLTRYLFKILILFGSTRTVFSDKYVDFLGFIRLTHHYTLSEKMNFINYWRSSHGNMFISDFFISEVLQCSSINEMSLKLSSYNPGIYELKKYTIWGAYPASFDYLFTFCQHNKFLIGVGVVVFISTAVLGYWIFAGRTSFVYEETVNTTLTTQGENSLELAKSSLEIVKVSDINTKIVDALLFSTMAIIQTLSLQLPFEGGFSGKHWQDFHTRLSDVYKFASKGKSLMDFVTGKENHTVDVVNNPQPSDPGYVLGHGDHHHPKCGMEDSEGNNIGDE